jgi:acyl-CoA thioester hydrolase
VLVDDHAVEHDLVAIVVGSGIAATRLGTTSFTIGTAFRVAGEERVIVTVETIYVLVDGKTLTKLPLTDAIRVALQEGAAGRVTDHAGYQSEK